MNYKIKITTFFAAIALLFAGCSKEKLAEINVDPNQSTDAPLHTILNAAMVGSIMQIEGENARLAGLWTQQFTGVDRQYAAYEIYNVNAGNFEWTGYYYGMAQQANLAIAKAETEGSNFYLGVARATKGLAFGITTSLWGDVPYSQANNLVDFPTPQFDDQVSVYAEVQNLLSDAITAFNADGSDTLGIDWYYGGNKDNWKKAVNSLKARYALHTKNYSDAISFATNGISTTAEDMMIPHSGGTYNQDMNIYYSFGKVDRELYMTADAAVVPAILDGEGAKNNEKTDESARFANLYVGGVGTYDLNYDGNWSPTSSFPVVTAIENFLIMSESYWRTNNMTDALLHLNNARAELAAMYPSGTYTSYVMDDFSNGGIADYGKGNANDNLLYEILLEKYASLAGQIEVFNDHRRTKNFLDLAPRAGSSFPERFLIPQTEYDGNPSAPAQSASDLYVPTAVNQ